jgi:hypothetical protein
MISILRVARRFFLLFFKVITETVAVLGEAFWDSSGYPAGAFFLILQGQRGTGYIFRYLEWRMLNAGLDKSL